MSAEDIALQHSAARCNTEQHAATYQAEDRVRRSDVRYANRAAHQPPALRARIPRGQVVRVGVARAAELAAHVQAQTIGGQYLQSPRVRMRKASARAHALGLLLCASMGCVFAYVGASSVGRCVAAARHLNLSRFD